MINAINNLLVDIMVEHYLNLATCVAPVQQDSEYRGTMYYEGCPDPDQDFDWELLEEFAEDEILSDKLQAEANASHAREGKYEAHVWAYALHTTNSYIPF